MKLCAAFWFFLSLFGICLPSVVHGASPVEEVPEPYRSLPQALRNRAEQLTTAPVTENGGTPQFFKMDLGAKAFAVTPGEQFAAFKFHTPKTPDLDLVWCFYVPQAWMNWYIVPAQGTMQGFRNWLNADRAYAEFPDSDSPPVVLQSLSSKSLQPDAEYYIWFHSKTEQPPAGTLTAALLFTGTGKGKRGWDHEAIEKALRLHNAPAAAQVAKLKSRGGAALLDDKLFDKGYGDERLNTLLADIRNTNYYPGGYYIGMSTNLPVCKKQPTLAELEKAHGEPDIVVTAKDREGFGEKLSKAEQKDEIAYYDYFGFTYRSADPQRRIYQVETTGFSAAHPQPPATGLSFTDVATLRFHCRVFYKDAGEIARISNWGEAGAKLVSGILPRGEYTEAVSPDAKGRDVMTYQGDGNWIAKTYNAEGKLETEMTAAQHVWNGPRTDYFPSGKKYHEATYKDGALEGVVREWDEDGKEMPKRYFKGGQPTAEP